ncbi:MAG: lipoyl(octanoyl) transferase LipB [Betaproteobacteria bacterium AqS2]|uniref:Octanoyltransferase n=1 Tax=Candidatus Amphirhobacter heronislandensis TaxID=1732024 RepID=A0A930UHF3_9GAMM|nr:lipoyl(octanoyl) transferase LipB [Betaproteobacteria bacterium AqS2]
MPAPLPPPAVRDLGRTEFAECLAAMRAYTDGRGEDGADEIWLTEHPPVYTLGQAGKPEHLLRPSAIPLVRTDRGGQITYHGPGQAIAYVLVDLRRRGYGVRSLVQRLEQATIALLAELGLAAARRAKMPGVYVADRKIAALGLRVRHGCSYHGVSLNLDCDLAPYDAINPCGYEGLRATSLRAEGVAYGRTALLGSWAAAIGAQVAAPVKITRR